MNKITLKDLFKVMEHTIYIKLFCKDSDSNWNSAVFSGYVLANETLDYLDCKVVKIETKCENNMYFLSITIES